MDYLKKASRTAASDERDVQDTVARRLREIEEDGQDKALEYARKLDGWDGKVMVEADDMKAAAERVPQSLKDDIERSHQRVKRFAEAQRDSHKEIEVEVSPGLYPGQRLIPVQGAGCYIPDVRYVHVASAIMSVTTAPVAGVDHVMACSPPRDEKGIHPAVLYALDVCGVDTVLRMGGVQGVASMAFGLVGGKPADILVGPGNQFVAEAKRLLFGRFGIDMFAGPSEILVIADETSDPEIVAEDLVGQAEHGPNTPAWLITTSRELADKVMARVPELIEKLPSPNKDNAEASWRDYGEVVLAKHREEVASISDAYASEQLEVHADDLDWWLGTDPAVDISPSKVAHGKVNVAWRGGSAPVRFEGFYRSP